MKTFHDIIGQEKARDMLFRGLEGGKLSHAYLFRGPGGVGKKSVALAFAVYINCLAPKNGDACGKCASCLQFHSGNYPDFISIEPAGAQIKIDQIRELKRQLTFSPFNAGYRIVLIPDIHVNLSRAEVANSLLKTLEEPAENTVFILTGDETGAILPTILSRCQIVPFHALQNQDVAALFLEYLPPLEAEALAAISEGSIGRARMFQDIGILSLRREIIESLLARKPADPYSVEMVFGLVEKVLTIKDNLDDLLDLLVVWVRDLLLYHHGITDLINSRDLLTLMAEAALRWPVATLFEQLNMLDKARRQLSRNCNRALVFEVLFFALL